MKIKDNMLTVAQLHSYHSQVIPFFAEKWTKMSRNEDRLKAQNWDSASLAKIKEQDRIAYSLPIAVSALNRIKSTQKQSRETWKVEAAHDPNDEVAAEIETYVMRDYESVEDMAHIESDVFEDGLGVSFGCDKFELKQEMGRTVIKNRVVDYYNLVWDINDKSYEVKYPLFIAEIERMPIHVAESQGLDVKHADNSTDALLGREELDYWGVGLNDDRTISIFHHYHRTNKKYYIVLFKDPANLFQLQDVIVKKTRIKKEADELKKRIEAIYNINGLLINDDDLSIEVEERLEYDYYKFTFNEILEYKETGDEFHPYNIYRSIRVKNDWISVLDFMASPQLFIDRLYSQIDYSLRSELKNVYELNTNALADGETANSVQNKVSKVGGVIAKETFEKVLTPVQSQGFNPQYIQMVGILQEAITDIMGGANSMGQKESASESGRAVALRQQQGKLVAFEFLDNLRRYKQYKGEKLLKLIKKYDTTERVIKVLGGDVTSEMLQFLMANGAAQMSPVSNMAYIKINSGVTAFQDKELRLVVDSAPMGMYERQQKLDMYAVAEQNSPFLAQSPVWNMIKLDALDIPRQDRAKLKQEVEQLIMMQQQQEQMQQQLQMQKSLPEVKQ